MADLVEIQWEWLTEEQQAGVRARALKIRADFIQFAIKHGAPPMEVVAWGADPGCAGLLDGVCMALAFEEYKEGVRDRVEQEAAVSQDEGALSGRDA